MTSTLRFTRATPANLLPFNEDLWFDEANYRRHLSCLVAVDGVDAIVCNGRASEVLSLDQENRRRALVITDEVGDLLDLIFAIYTDSTSEAAEFAKDAKAGGVAGLLIFPPTLFMWSTRLRPEVAVVHFETIAEATDLRFIVFDGRRALLSGLRLPVNRTTSRIIHPSLVKRPRHKEQNIEDS